MARLNHTIFEGGDSDVDEDALLDQEADAVGRTLGDLADFRSMFDIGSFADEGARDVGSGVDGFLGGPLARNYVEEDMETCIS